MRLRPYLILVIIVTLMVTSCTGDTKVRLINSAPDVEGMSFIRGGPFIFTFFEEQLSVTVQSFYLDRHQVSIREFANFVEETGYMPTSESIGSTSLYLRELEHSGHDVNPFFRNAVLETGTGVTWRHDERGNLRDTSDWHFPVVHVSIEDARAYANWAGKRLPTIYEWKYATLTGYDFEELYDWIAQNAWHSENSEGIMEPGRLDPDKNGVYDLIGNINELVEQGEHEFTTPNMPSRDSIALSAASSFIKSVNLMFPPIFSVSLSHMTSYERGFRCAMDVPQEK